MAKKKSLPTQIKEILHYHAFRRDLVEDAEYVALMNDLSHLEQRVAEVKSEIMSNRDAKAQAKLAEQQAQDVFQATEAARAVEQAKAFTQSIFSAVQTPETKSSD